ncbi:MAG: hypothetical protein AAGE52_23910 [Myxococcota bacterium]
MASRWWIVGLVGVAACSFVRDASDFTLGDGGVSDAGCARNDECPAPERAFGVCTDGICGFECEPGFEDCDGNPANGCEANLRSTGTCGACDVLCAGEELCDSTQMTPVCSETCDGTVCGDECVDTRTNPLRCRRCDNECSVPPGAQQATCADAICGFVCEAERADCNGIPEDGCEIDTEEDVDHCGECDAACDTTNVSDVECRMGACGVVACEDGFDDCNGDAGDGCEAELASDPTHCGACGNTCEVGTNCVEGVCDPVVQVDRGEGQGCLRRESGQVFCWGENESGQAGAGIPRGVERAQRIEIEGVPFRARFVSAGNQYTCAIDLDGALWCWGQGSRLGAGPAAADTGVPQSVVADTDTSFSTRTFDALDLNELHACAVDTMGDVWCWGDQQNGAIPGSGDADGARRVSGLPDEAIDVAVNNGASCAALRSGEVWCWGSGSLGQLGNGGTANRSTPVQALGIADAESVDANWRTFCARTTAGRLLCWGDNNSGHLGSTVDDRFEATPIEIAAGVREAWQSLWSLCWLNDEGVSCLGRNQEAQYGNGETTPRGTGADGVSIRVPELDGFSNFDGGRRGGCALQGGRAHCWGASFEGSVPRDDLQVDEPTSLAGLDGTPEAGYAELAVGEAHACAVRTGIARCWGNNSSGALGDGTSLSEARAGVVVDLTNVTQVTVGVGHSCAIDDEGGETQAWCWGGNSSGQLGSVGSSATRPQQVDLAGEERAIVAGSFFTCAIDETRNVQCWGANSEGQVGRPASANEAPGPTARTFDNVVAIAAGHVHACALRSTGVVECWGSNESRQLGVEGPGRHTPMPVPGLTNVDAIAAGNAHTCALESSGQVRCWGSAFRGQLGGTPSGAAPVLVDYTAMAAVAIAAGETHSCAAYVDGSVRCWGGNEYSQLGIAGGDDRRAPVVVPGASATALSAGSLRGFSTCGLNADDGGSIQCWGRNEFGIAGNGVSLYLAPTPVALP